MIQMITPRPGPGVCPICFNFTRVPAGLCRACGQNESHLRVIAPISYAAAGSELHANLADYKRAAEPAVPDLARQLSDLLASFLAAHERCVATAAGVPCFDAVVAVPAGTARRDRLHPLRQIVEALEETRGRTPDVLRRSGTTCVPHAFDPRRFTVTGEVAGLDVLLIDDVWTTGASAQSAAAVLLAAGAASVSAVVIGRYVNGCWGGIAERLEAMAQVNRSGRCVLCAGADGVDAGLLASRQAAVLRD